MKITLLLATFFLLYNGVFSQDYRATLWSPSVAIRLNALSYSPADNTVLLETQSNYDSARVFRINAAGRASQSNTVEPTTDAYPHAYSSDGEWSIAYGRNLSDNHLSGLEIINLRTNQQKHVAFGSYSERCWFDYAAPGAPFRFSTDNSCALVRVYKDVNGRWSRMIALVHLEDARLMTFVVDTAYAYRTDCNLLDASVDINQGTAIFIYQQAVSGRSTFIVRVQNIENGQTREVVLSDLETGSRALSQYSVQSDSIIALVYGSTSARRIVFDAESLEPIGSTMMLYSQFCTDLTNLIVQPSTSLGLLCLIEQHGQQQSMLHFLDCVQESEIDKQLVSMRPLRAVLPLGDSLLFLCDASSIIRYRMHASAEVCASVPKTSVDSRASNLVRLQEVMKDQKPQIVAANSYTRVQSWMMSDTGLITEIIKVNNAGKHTSCLPRLSSTGEWLFSYGQFFKQSQAVKSPSTIYDVRFFNHSNACVCIDPQFTLQLRDLHDLETERVSMRPQVQRVEIAPNDSTVAVVLQSGVLAFLSPANLGLQRSVESIRSVIKSLQFSADSRWLCVHCDMDTVLVIEVASGQVVSRAFIGGLQFYSLNAQASVLYCHRSGNVVEAFSLPSFRTLGRFKHSVGDVCDIHEMSDGSALVLATKSNEILVWRHNSLILDIPEPVQPLRGTTLSIDNLPLSNSYMHIVHERLDERGLLKIYGLNGAELLSTLVNAGSSENTIDVGTLINGSYICTLTTNDKVRSATIVVAR